MGRCSQCLLTCVKAVQWLPVLIIIGALSWGYYAYVFQLCFRYVESDATRVIYLIFFHLLLGIFVASYYKTTFTKLRKVDESYVLPKELADEVEVNKTNPSVANPILRRFIEHRGLKVQCRAFDGGFRYCFKCKCIKPDRAHHCSVCGHCILKFDHHCPWVNTCVSFDNYKFFMLFMGYGMLFCLYCGITDLPYFIRIFRGFSGRIDPEGFHVIIIVFVSGMFAMSLSFLFFYHLYLISKNRTTLESFHAPMLEGGPDKNAFNHGISANFREVFGTDRWKWFLPVFTSCGDGHEYETRVERQMSTTLNNGVDQSSTSLVQMEAASSDVEPAIGSSPFSVSATA